MKVFLPKTGLLFFILLAATTLPAISQTEGNLQQLTVPLEPAFTYISQYERDTGLFSSSLIGLDLIKVGLDFSSCAPETPEGQVVLEQYKKLVQEVETCAKALKTIGVREGDKVTIAMPNCPQAIYLFYAVNLVGGIANMIHPLSAEKEIEF